MIDTFDRGFAWHAATDAPDPQTGAVPIAVATVATVADWARGVDLLRRRACPEMVPETRWAQIVDDAFKLSTAWCSRAVDAAWTVEELFGFDPQTGGHGVAVALAGRPLVGFDHAPKRPLRHRYASMRAGNGFAWHAAEMPVGSPLLWTFDERKMRS